MSDIQNLCVRCDRPTPDGYACSPCANHAARQLHEIADMIPAARDVAQRQTSRGWDNIGGTSDSLPINLAATQRLDVVLNTLSTWSRLIADERGVPLP